MSRYYLSSIRPVVRYFVLFVLLTATLISPLFIQAQNNPLIDAAARMSDIGAYAFTADIEQTLHPLPIPANIGRSSERADMRLTGHVTPPNQAEINMQLEGTGLDMPALTIIQDGNTYFLIKNGEREEIENPYETAVPNGDFLAYLHAADNIQTTTDNCPANFTCYTFDIDGYRFAEHIRQQAEKMEAMAGNPRSLSPSPMLQKMSGDGKVWLDENSYLQRQELNLHLPKLNDEYNADIHMIMDFDQLTINDAPLIINSTSSSINGRQTLISASQLASSGVDGFIIPILPYLAVSLLVTLLFIRHRTRRLAYNIVAVVMTIIMLTVSHLQTAVYAHQSQSQSDTPTLAQALGVSDEQSTENNQQLTTSNTPSQLANSQTSATCGEGDPNTDTDEDGFNDRDENCYGTDLYSIDSDNDLITDTTEIEGFMFDGRIWPSDPISIDSNNDGFSDTAEWPRPIGDAPNDDDIIDDADWDPDGDGIPNLWDDDNDGDNITDRLDISPFYVSDYQSSFSLTTDAHTGVQYIELHVQPQNEASLRYNTTPLDWPYDEKGQWRDLDDSTDDLKLIPMLKVITDEPPSDELMEDYGASAFCEEGEPCELLLPLTPMGDGGRIVAFASKTAYDADTAVEWQSIELIWMAQFNNDTQDGDNVKTEKTVAHTYSGGDFRLTALQLIKNDGAESAVFGTPATPTDDQVLFNLLLGLSLSFQNNQNPDLETVHNRFTSANTPDWQTWGVDKNNVETNWETYAHSDASTAGMGQRIEQMLDDHYDPAQQSALVIATTNHSGVYSANNLVLSSNESQISIDTSDVPIIETRSLRLSMYQSNEGDWEILSLEEVYEELEGRHDDLSAPLAELQIEYPDLEESDLRAVLAMFYAAWYIGQTRIHSMDGTILAPEQRDDMDIKNKLDDSNTSFLASYLVESADLGQPGGSLRVNGDLSKDWEYHRDNADANAMGIYDNTQKFFQTAETDWQTYRNISYFILQGWRVISSAFTALQTAQWAAQGTYRGLLGITGAGSRAAHGWFTHMGSSIRTLGYIGLAVGIILTIVVMVVNIDWSNPVSIQSGFSFAIATIIIAVLLFTLSLIPFGAIVVAILTAIDLIFLLATNGEFSPITWFTRVMATFFYDNQVLSYLDDTKFTGMESGWSDPDMGMIVGNSFVISDEFVGIIKKGDGQFDHEDEALDDSWVDVHFHGSASAATVADRSERNACSIENGVMTCTDPANMTFQFHSTAINAELTFKATMEAKTFYEVCRFAYCSRKTDFTHFPEDLPKEDRWGSTTLYMDVLPATLDELWQWNALTNYDPDGDGLLTERENELGLNPNDWDSDGDMLSDKFEVDNADDLGCEADNADSDGDGLSDGEEFRLGTRMDDPDSDGDGISDADEIYRWDGSSWTGGWTINLPEYGGSALVLSSPNIADADLDDLNDYSERDNSISPHAYNDVPRLTMEASPLFTPNGGEDGDVYAAAGETAVITITLESIGPKAITDTLELCLPDFVSSISGGAMQGHRQPATQTNGNCLSWTFSGSDTLQVWETVSTTVQATVNPAQVISVRDSITATLPYRLAGETRDITVVEEFIADADNPEVNFMAPVNGELIGGGVSSYVIGGTASDDASWVTQIQLTLPSGSVTAEGTGTWAHTWNLPADGNYTLTAVSTDVVNHTSPADSVTVMVDNTAPVPTLDLADGAVISGAGLSANNAITITLSGTTSDNLSGITRVQMSIDSRPWREIWAGAGNPLNITWQTDWVLPNRTSSQGEHSVRVRAYDRAGNLTAPLERTIIVDVVPPTDQLTDNNYTADDPPHVIANQPLTLEGVANDAGRVPDAPNPADLTGNLHSVDDATVWLGSERNSDDDDGVTVTWLGDFNGDRLADAAIGLPASVEDDGRVILLYGKAGGWELPTSAELLPESYSSFVGINGSQLGQTIAPAGDVNNDGFADLLIGDPDNNRLFLVLGRVYDVGRDVVLDGEATTAVWQLNGPANATIGQIFSSAGDVNGDGFGDLLVAAVGATETTSYLLLGRQSEWVGLDEAVATMSNGGTAVSLSTVGDRDNDEYDEFAIAANNSVYIFAGSSSFTINYQSATLTSGDAAVTFNSADTAPAILPVGDTDSDNLPDFIYDNGDSPTLVFADDTTHAFAGHNRFLAAPGDVNNDGRADILLGAGNDAHLFHGGAVGSVQATIEGVQTAASAPYLGAADLNSDGSDDLLVVPTAAARGNTAMATMNFATTIKPEQLPMAAEQLSIVNEENRQSAIDNAQLILSKSPQNVTLPETYYVDDDGVCEGNTPCYGTIQGAVNAADGGGDTVTIYAGVYAPFTIEGATKDRLTVSGINANLVYVDGGGGETAVTITNTKAITLSNMSIYNAANGVTIDHAGEDGWQNDSERIVLHHLLVRDVTAHAIYVDRFSSLRLNDNTLAAPSDGDATATIYVYGGIIPAWSAPSTDSRFGTDGNMFADDRYLYIYPHDNSSDIEVYDTVDNAWETAVSAPPDAACGVEILGMDIDENGNIWAMCKRWDGSNDRGDLYRYSSGSWSGAISTMPLTINGPGTSLMVDNDHLSILRGGAADNEVDQIEYLISNNTWYGQNSYTPGIGMGATQTRESYVYGLVGGGSTYFQRHDNYAYGNVTDTPWPIGEGAGLVGDGRDWLYVFPGGNGDQFSRYHSVSYYHNQYPWDTLDPLPTGTVIRDGAGLVRINNTLYVIPGNNVAQLLTYGPVGVYHDDKIVFDDNSFVHPDDSDPFIWYRLENDTISDWMRQPDDYNLSGNSNTWVGGSSRSPDPNAYRTPLTSNSYLNHTKADYVDLNNGVYRLGDASIQSDGYETGYVAEMTVDISGGGDTTSIQDAINSGARRIIVKAGVYAETIAAWPDVEIIGVSADRVIIEPSGTPASALVSAEGIVGFTLQGVTLNGDNQGIDGFHAEDGTIDAFFRRNIVRGTDTAVVIDGSGTDLELVNNNIIANTDGLRAINCASVDVRNTIFSNNSGTGLYYEGCAATKLHTYNLYWNNGTNQNPAVTGAGELYLDPLFVDAPAHNYHTTENSPVIDAGNPSDPHPPGTSERVDIGYIEQGRAAFYVDLDYCDTCENNGLTWGVDAFDNIPDGLSAAETEIAALTDLSGQTEPLYTVYVGDGTYWGNLTPPSYVRLAGSGPDTTKLDTSSGNLITVDGAFYSEIRDIWMEGGTCSVYITGGSRAITVTRNVFTRNLNNDGVCLDDRADALISFNTFYQIGNGVHLYNSSNTAVIINNIFASVAIELAGHSRTAHNVDIRYNYLKYLQSWELPLPLGSGNDDTYDGIQFVDSQNGNFRLLAGSRAIDAADPDADVPEGGGSRADMGAFEYQGVETVPATLLLGHENASTALANSGVNGVEIGVVPVADPTDPVTATEPSSWTAVSLNSPGSTVSEWNEMTTPATDGLYRFYSRAADEAGNQETDQWYDGAFIADGTPPVVTWLAPASGSANLAPLELRAQVSDYALDEFSVADFYFMVDGVRQDASWSHENWDEDAQDPRVFRAWVDLGNGAPIITAVAVDHAGNTGQSAAVTFTVSGQNPADTVDPALVITSPTPDTHYQASISFSGTATDAGSGIEVVQISLDGGWHWEMAELNGNDWEYLLENDNNMLAAINYRVAIRALDKAGNETRPPDFIVSIDNRPPSGLLPVTLYIEHEYDVQLEPESHLDMPDMIDMRWIEAFDFSDNISGNVVTLLAVDQISDTTPIVVLPDDDVARVVPFSSNGDWYVHLAARDLVDNQIVYHFGPYHVGTISDATPLGSRVQSIIIDGLMDFEHDEWRMDWEYLDDGEDVNSRQELYFTLDNSGVYLGWRNSWWDTDGTMWAYLDTAAGGTTQPITPADPTLPFAADYAVQVTGSITGTVWQYNVSGLIWEKTAVIPLNLVQGSNGDTELKLNLSLAATTNLQTLVYAAADDGDIWRVFPTTNPLNGIWNNAYQWNPQTTVDFNEGQPVGTSVTMEMDSPQPSDLFHGPNEMLDLVFTLNNLEQRTVSGLQLDVNTTTGLNFTGVISGTCSTCDANHYVVDVPDMPPTTTLQITVTGQLAADLSAITAVTHTVSFNSTPSQSDSLHHLTDGLPPEVDVRLTPGNVTVGGGMTTTQTMYGTADDNGGSGITLVEVRFNGGAWQPATGTTNWSTQMNLAAGNITLEARATDAVSLTSLPTNTTYIVDTTPPTLTLSLPLTLTGQYAEFGGTARDLAPANAQVAQIQVQIDDANAPWLPAATFQINGGQQKWHATWHLPADDLQPHQVRARAVDWAGNVSDPLGWQIINVDNVLPALNSSQLLDEVFSDNYTPVTVLNGTVSDGSGVAKVEVWLYDPDGLAYTQTATIDQATGAWYFQPDFNNPPNGRYGLWVEATDNSGNQTHIGPYWLEVLPDSPDAYADPDLVRDCDHNEPCFTSLQDAIDAVNATERVYAYGGVYNEAVTLDKDVTVNASETMTFTGDLNIQAGTFIAPAGELTAQGDFGHSGGAFNHNNGRFIFGGSGVQIITDTVTFYNLTVSSGITLTADAAVTIDGQVVYEDGAAAIETKSIGSTGMVVFDLMDMTVDVGTQGSLSSLEIKRIESHHPQATGTDGGSGIHTGRYWHLTPNIGANDTFSVTLTLPHDGIDTPKVCKYPGGLAGFGWDCDQDGFDTDYVWRSGIDSFSDWAVGDNTGPTAVMLQSFGVGETAVSFVWLFTFLMLLAGVWVWRQSISKTDAADRKITPDK